jgi:hypothetical protein
MVKCNKNTCMEVLIPGNDVAMLKVEGVPEYGISLQDFKNDMTF